MELIIILVGFYSIYDMIVTIIIKKKDFHYLKDGYTPLWLTILYIIGGYFGKYLLSQYKKTKFINHIFWISIYLCSSFFSYEILFITLKRLFLNYISPTILIQALSLILFFSRLSIKNYLLKKIISFFTPLTFNIIKFLYRKYKINIYNFLNNKNS